MSNPEPPDSPHLGPALHELEQLVHSMGDELAAFRKRAQAAETRLKSLESAAKGGDLFGEQRVGVLEAENTAFKTRTQQAVERIRVLLAQMRFLRQQREQAVQAMSIADR